MPENRMTFWQLMSMLKVGSGTRSVVIDSNGDSHIGYVQGVEREDGSGHNFNVNILTEYRGAINVFVRTID